MLAGDEPGYGADVNAADRSGNTPLHTAAKSAQSSSARFLMSLHAELEIHNSEGDTALHLAVRAESLRTAKDLLLKGANRAVRNERGRTPAQDAEEITDRQLKKSFKSALVSVSASLSSLMPFFFIIELSVVLRLPTRSPAADARVEEQPLGGAVRHPFLLHRDHPARRDRAR